MDALKLLKQDWKKNTTVFQKVSETEIYAMLHKKSSSIVKWIVIISVLEILFWGIISFLIDDKETDQMLRIYHIKTIIDVIGYVNYVVILGFIFLFYKNYKTINSTDTVKKLMQTILKTRRTVKYYVWYNLIVVSFSALLVFGSQLYYDPNIVELIDNFKGNTTVFYIVIGVIYTIILTIILGFFILFYKLLYGILIKRLRANYKELKKIDL